MLYYWFRNQRGFIMDEIVKDWIADPKTPMLATTKRACAMFDSWLVARHGYRSGLSSRQFAWVLKRCAYKWIGKPTKQWVLKCSQEI